MKILATLFASFVLTAAASAVEYVTLTSKTSAKAIPAGALVEIVGWGAAASDNRFQIVNLSFVDGQNSSISFTGAILAGGTQRTPISNRKYIYSGLTNVSLVTDANGGHYRFSVTLKITPASELNSVASGVVTLPADVGAGYTLTLQESSDLSIWNAVFPGAFTGEATPKFFRVLLKKPAAR